MAITTPSRNLALELVRVTETAAIAASRWIGRGSKNEADQSAVDGMRKMINTVAMDGIIVIEKVKRMTLQCYSTANQSVMAAGQKLM